MSLNDPRWGRESDQDTPKDDKTDRDREQNAYEARDRDNRASQNDDRRDENRAPNGKNKNNRDDEWMTLEEFWEQFFNGTWEKIFGKKPTDSTKKKWGEGLKSRDDFSRGDEPDTTSAPRGDYGGAHRYGQEHWFNEDAVRGRDNGGNGGNGGMPPRMPVGKKASGIGASFLIGAAILGWAATGFYIVPEGQTGVVTTFGRYSETTAPGFRWHLPVPIQNVDMVDVSSVRTAELGAPGRPAREREALMLTDDENIVDMQFTVQYRIKPGDGARDYVFNIRQPERTVVQAAESAMREVVGRRTMDSVLFESKAEIALAVRKSMQSMLDRYHSGIEVMSVAIQNAQPPQPVQAAFNDAVKAGQDRERSINLGEEYRNAVLPKARGTAARLTEEAKGYQARVTETARGDAARFKALYREYAKAPQVTRDRMYIDTVRDVMGRTTKVYVDAKDGNNMLYMPFDKLVENTRQSARESLQRKQARIDDPGVMSGAASQMNGESRRIDDGRSSLRNR